MANIFGTEDSVFFVGGTGTKAGTGQTGGCTKAWFDDNFTTLSDIMGVNGAPLIEVENATPSGGDTLTKVGEFGDAEVGMVAYLSGTDVVAPGRYKILTVSADVITFPAGTFTGVTADVTCNIGGAFNDISNADDNVDASSYDVMLYTNKDENYAQIDTGGGSTGNYTWLNIEGFHTLPGDMRRDQSHWGEYVLYYNTDSVVAFLIDEISHVRCWNIEGRAGAASGIKLTASMGLCYGFVFNNCKSIDSVLGFEIPSSFIRHITIIGGYYSCWNNSNGRPISITTNGSLVITGAEIVSPAIPSFATLKIGVAITGTAVVENCIIIAGGGNGSEGRVHCSTEGTYVLRNNVIYSVATKSGHAVWLNAASLIEYNNIFVVGVAANWKAIHVQAGNILYSDYSCTNSTATDRWGGEPTPAHAVEITEADIDFVDAAGSDFRPRNPAVLRGGRPDIAGNPTQMGAVQQKYQFKDRARIANMARLGIIR